MTVFLAALGPADGPDVRGLPDGTLLHLRDTYPIETAWAPKWVGDELRQVRAGARDARLAAIRAAAEAAAAQRRAQAFPPWPAPAKDAILQPPKPEIQPSARILERAQDHDLDIEAAD